MIKPVYLDLSILNPSTAIMYEFWYDYAKTKYDEYVRHCYMNTGSFTVHMKTEDIYNDIPEDVETRFDPSNFKLDRPLAK